MTIVVMEAMKSGAKLEKLSTTWKPESLRIVIVDDSKRDNELHLTIPSLSSPELTF